MPATNLWQPSDGSSTSLKIMWLWISALVIKLYALNDALKHREPILCKYSNSKPKTSLFVKPCLPQHEKACGHCSQYYVGLLSGPKNSFGDPCISSVLIYRVYWLKSIYWHVQYWKCWSYPNMVCDSHLKKELCEAFIGKHKLGTVKEVVTCSYFSL